jgi:hypothetical protein
MQTLWQDLRYGARMLLKRPGFALLVLLMTQIMTLGWQAPAHALVIKDVTISNTKKIFAVIVGGRYYDKAARQKMIESAKPSAMRK